MTWCSWAQRLAWLSLIWALAACAPGRLAPPSRVPNALSSFVVWSALPVEAGWSAQGTPVDVVHVRGGDVLRLIAASNGPVAVAERMQSESGAAEEWSSVTSTDGVIMLRATPFTTELQWSRGAIRLAYVGKGSNQ